MKKPKWYWHIWWWFGGPYGLYKLNWWLKKRYGDIYMDDRELYKIIKEKIKDFLSFLLCLILIPFWLLAGFVLAGIGKVCDLFRYLKKKI